MENFEVFFFWWHYRTLIDSSRTVNDRAWQGAACGSSDVLWPVDKPCTPVVASSTDVTLGRRRGLILRGTDCRPRWWPVVNDLEQTCVTVTPLLRWHACDRYVDQRLSTHRQNRWDSSLLLLSTVSWRELWILPGTRHFGYCHPRKHCVVSTVKDQLY